MSYITGKIIKELREKKKLTQKELGEVLHLSDKTISKWETSKGLPDIAVLEDGSGFRSIHRRAADGGSYRK